MTKLTLLLKGQKMRGMKRLLLNVTKIGFEYPPQLASASYVLNIKNIKTKQIVKWGTYMLLEVEIVLVSILHPTRPGGLIAHHSVRFL